MHPDPRLPIPGSPQCAVLTPTGRGAIATIAVRGVRAIEVVSRRFAPAAGKPLPSFAVGRVLFGRFRTSAEVPEELVVGLVAPGEIEIHCHGGQAAVQAICEALIDDGCALVTADEWIHEQESDPLAAQAMLALADARTESAAAILLDQYRGVLMAELCKIEELLARPQMAAATAAIEGLLTRAEIGVHLTRSWKIVIAGAPNA